VLLQCAFLSRLKRYSFHTCFILNAQSQPPCHFDYGCTSKMSNSSVYMYFVSNRVKEDAAGKRERGWGSFEQAGVTFRKLSRTEAQTNQLPPSSSLFLLLFFPSLRLCAFSENYLHLFKRLLPRKLLCPSHRRLSPPLVSIVFDVLCPRFRRIVGVKSPRAKAAENQRTEYTGEGKKNREERTARRNGGGRGGGEG